MTVFVWKEESSLTTKVARRRSSHWWAWLLAAIMAPIGLTAYAIIEFLSSPSMIRLAYSIGFGLVSFVNVDILYNSGKRNMPYVFRPFHLLESVHYKTRYDPSLDGITHNADEKV